MKTIEVCLTPELIHQHVLEGKFVVVVDIFRATSCMVTGLACGVSAIYPVSTVESCLALGSTGMLTAGERGGIKIEEFDLGNSPFEYQQDFVKGKLIAVSTTNGIQAIASSAGAQKILIGAFLNISATANFLIQHANHVLIHCAGWKGTPNLEDTLYAGALIQWLGKSFELEGDSAKLAKSLYLNHQHDLLAIAKESSHAKRLAGFGITDDIAFCVSTEVYSIVCHMVGDKIVTI
jgi:2-phosphosulfolactate phosphatase